MSRSYRKQPVWKDHNKDSKKHANRRLRRAMNRNHDLSLPLGSYKKYNESWDICDYCSLVPRDFEQYWQHEIIAWNKWRHFRKDEPFPDKREVYKEWLHYRNK